MTTPQLLDYVSSQLKLGTAKDTITKALISQGWTQDDVNEAFALMPKPAAFAPLPASAPVSMPTAVSPASPSFASTPTFVGGTVQPRVINQLDRPGMPVSISMSSSMPTAAPVQPRTFTPPMQQFSSAQQQSPIPRQFTASPMAASPMVTPTDAQRKALMHQDKPQSHVLFELLILLLGILIGATGVFAYYTMFK